MVSPTFFNLSLNVAIREPPGGSDGTASVYNVGDPGSIPWVGKIPWRRKWQSTPVLLPGKSHGQGSQVGYRQWRCKESDRTEQLHVHLAIRSVSFPFVCADCIQLLIFDCKEYNQSDFGIDHL